MQSALPNAVRRPSKKLLGWGIVIVILVALVSYGVSTYNSLNLASKDVDAAWSKVQVQYQRRADLIPNLVNSVKGYTAHESGTLEAVTNARAGLASAEQVAMQSKDTPAPLTEQEMQNYLAAQDRLKSALSVYVNAVHEAYPELKANSLFEELNVQLEGTENRIATERGRYTEIVRDYNIKVSRFPAVLFARMLGFGERPQFQATAEAQSAPVVQF